MIPTAPNWQTLSPQPETWTRRLSRTSDFGSRACYDGINFPTYNSPLSRAIASEQVAMRRNRSLLLWLLVCVLVAGYQAPPLSGHSDSDALVLVTTLDTGGAPSAIVVDQAVGRHDIIFYDGNRVRFVDGDTLTLSTNEIPLPTTAWEGWMVYDTTLQQAYVVTIRRRETSMHVYWKEEQVHVVAGRAILGSFSVNGIYNTDPLDPEDRFHGLNGLVLKPPISEGSNPGRLILDDTANGNIDVVDLNVTGTDAIRRQRYSYRDSLCTESTCSWTTIQGNTLALEAKHETATPDDLATVDALYIADPNYREQGVRVYGHLRTLQLNHPDLELGAIALPDVDLSTTSPFRGGIQGLAMATGRDVLYVASGQQSFDTGYIGEVNTVSGQSKQVIELTYGDQGFVHVDPQDPLRTFVGTFDGWYNDPDQALYLHLLYDGTVIDSLKLVDSYDEYNGLRDMVYDPLHRRLYLAVGSRIVVVQVYQEATCPNPLTDVDITGPGLGEINTTYTYHAVNTPPNPTPPVTYTWSPTPLTGQGTAVATYRWATAGDYALWIETENCGGMRTATRETKIVAEELACVFLPVVVR